MSVVLNESELAILTLHMNIMRNNIKKGFKANYGILEGRKKLKIYDNIKQLFSSIFDEDIEEYELPKLEDEEVEMLYSFVDWYTKELKLAVDKEEVQFKNNETIQVFEQIKDKLDSLIIEKNLVGGQYV